MRKIEDLKSMLVEFGYENSVVLEDPSYCDALVGVTDSGSVVYDYEKMIECLMVEDDMTMEDATEFIDYNTDTYMHSVGVTPTILYPIETWFE